MKAPTSRETLSVYMERHTHPDVYLYRNIWNGLAPGTRERLCIRLTNLSYYNWLLRQSKVTWYRPYDYTAASIAIMYLTAGYDSGAYLRKTRSTMHDTAVAMQEYIDKVAPSTIISELVQAAMTLGIGTIIYENVHIFQWKVRKNPHVCRLPIVSEHLAYLDTNGEVALHYRQLAMISDVLGGVMPHAGANDDYMPYIHMWK